MGLLDDLLGHVQSQLGASAPATHPDLVATVLQMLGSSSFTGLVQQFERAGLGPIIQSWIGTGQNLPISAQRLEQALGSGQLQAMAAKLGLSPQAVSEQLARVLPHVVNHMTPGGRLPAAELLGDALGMLKKLM
jgi:uncharacterized protein YidB (DUF937 family)